MTRKEEILNNVKGEYQNIFDTQDSDDLIEALRIFQSSVHVEDAVRVRNLQKQLYKLLDNYVATESAASMVRYDALSWLHPEAGNSTLDASVHKDLDI